MKNLTPCFPEKYLEIPVDVDGVSFKKPYSLVSVVCHAGSLNNGHYYSYVKSGINWLKCNDKAVNKANFNTIDPITPYILFCKRI